MGRRAFATKEERFDFERGRIHEVWCDNRRPGIRKCGVTRTAGPPQPEVRTATQRRYDAAMRDPATRQKTLRDRAKRLAITLRTAISHGLPSIRVMGLGGNRVTVVRADMDRMARACDVLQWGAQ